MPLRRPSFFCLLESWLFILNWHPTDTTRVACRRPPTRRQQTPPAEQMGRDEFQAVPGGRIHRQTSLSVAAAAKAAKAAVAATPAVAAHSEAPTTTIEMIFVTSKSFASQTRQRETRQWRQMGRLNRRHQTRGTGKRRHLIRLQLLAGGQIVEPRRVLAATAERRQLSGV